MKKAIAILLALVLMFGAALPAFAFPMTEEGEDETFGIAKGYVRTKEVQKNSDGSSNSVVTSYNKQGKPVKQVETWKEKDYTSTTTTVSSYDKKGNLTEEIIYYNDYISTSTYVYNKAGQETKYVHRVDFEDNTSMTTTTLTTYNKSGKEAKKVSYHDDSVETTVYTYNKAGKLTKEVTNEVYEDNTKDTMSTSYTFDKKGNEIKMVMTYKDRYGTNEKRSFVSEYNKKNLCIKKTEQYSFTDSDGIVDKTVNVTTYTYDKKGNVTNETFKSTYSDGSKRTVTFVSTYNESGKLVKQVTTEKSAEYSSKTTTSYAYKSSRLVKEVTVIKDSDGTTKTVETYAYDKAGNLTKHVNSGSYADGTTSKYTTTYAYQKIGA